MVYLKTDDIEITLEPKELKHFRIRTATDLRQFAEAFRSPKPRKRRIGFDAK